MRLQTYNWRTGNPRCRDDKPKKPYIEEKTRTRNLFTAVAPLRVNLRARGVHSGKDVGYLNNLASRAGAQRGLEPPRLSPLVPETSASTNSATWAARTEIRAAFSACQRQAEASARVGD